MAEIPDDEGGIRRFVLGTEIGRDRVDKILVRLASDLSRAAIQRWIVEGRLRLSGRVCRASDRAGPGDVLELSPGEPPPSSAKPDADVRFAVLYEDEDLVVVDKPPGLVVHPARGHWTGTLVNGLLARDSFRAAPADPRDPWGTLRPGIVHRIDKDTSGILVVAKNDQTREGLKQQLAAHSAERRYRAISLGVPKTGTIRTGYGRDPRSRLRFTSLTEHGKPAITHVELSEKLAGGRAALIECRLETGRTHQIRVHLAEQTKTPLLGDRLYRARSIPHDLLPIAERLGRQALHAARLGFVHPKTGAPLTFDSPLPADIEEALTALRALG